MKIAVLSSHTPSLFYFRLDMMRCFQNKGCEVVAIANEAEDDWAQRFSEEGIAYRQAEIYRNSTNPLRDIKTLLSLYAILKEERPDKVFTYQAKTIIYGGIAAQLLGINEVYPLIAGLGSVFISTGIKASVIRSFLKLEYRAALRKSPSVFFQNTDDSDMFLKSGLVKQNQITMLNGSGVNLQKFTMQPLPAKPAFLYIGRLIKDKGVFEYLEACKLLKEKIPNVRCMLIGPFDTNPSALKESELRPYIDEKIIEYFGEQSDVRPYIAQCGIFVLPSYREGTPKAVLEAMAMGRAIITTSTPGCRETVIDGENGFMVPTKSVQELADSMYKFAVTPELVSAMGHKSRKIAEEKFDVRKVNAVISKTMRL